MTDGPFQNLFPRDKDQPADEVSPGITPPVDPTSPPTADADGTGEDTDTASTDPFVVSQASTDTDTAAPTTPVPGNEGATPSELEAAELVSLLSESGIDTIWLDLDGDLIPETAVDLDGPFDVAISEDGDPMDPWASDSWITFPVEQDGVPVYDLTQLGPADPYGVDWTSEDACGYDPMALPTFNVDAGPISYDPTTYQPLAPVDYTDQSLWFNDGSYDQGAGYWNPGYAGTPAGADLSGWAPAGNAAAPMTFDQMQGTWDPLSPPPFSFDPANPLPTYTPSFEGFDPTNPLPTYTPYNGDPTTLPGYQAFAEAGGSLPPLPGVPGYLPMSPGASGWDAGGAADGGAWTGYGGGSDAVTSYFTDYSFDNQLSQGSEHQNFWMTEYNDASALQSDYWNASVEASVAGNDLLAYDLNQLSLQSGSYAADAWSYSSTSYDPISTTSGGSADDGWYDAMSLD